MYKEVEKMTNSKKMNPQKLKDMLLKYALYIILLLLLVVIVAIKPNFLSVGNLISILKQASTKGILAYGVAGIIILPVPTCPSAVCSASARLSQPPCCSRSRSLRDTIPASPSRCL